MSRCCSDLRLLMSSACLLALPLWDFSQTPAAAEEGASFREKMSYLDNGVIRLGADLNKGGAITYFSASGSDENVVNSFDYGRQIQMSYYRLMAYTGDKPFTGGALTRVVKPAGEPGPWTHWNATENWSALVRDDGWGLGVWHLGCYSFGGGFAGEPGKGGPKDSPTGYISPGHNEVIDWNIEHEFRYVLILGTLDEIRQYVCQHAEQRTTPEFHFEHDRQHWIFFNARDAGWPLRGEWNITLEGDDPQLISPDGFWQAADSPTLYIRAAYRGAPTRAQLFWKTFAKPGFSEENSLSFAIEGDGEYRTYAVPLASAPGYSGAITGLRIDPAPRGEAGDFFKVRSVTAKAPKE